ncbi:MAG: LacI family DNA-binding transcriptional regulator [Clostridia bacterium]|nr:LacI family DNA-binding transcriptional regulator [Clostridia bacterium]
MNHLTITTAELAKICGVSQGTVDRALNNRADIKAETKQHILRVAREYGYRDLVAPPRPERSVGQIGIVIFNLNNEYFSRLVTEIEFILRGLGLSAVVMMTHYDRQCEIECIRNLYNMGVKGIILCSIGSGVEYHNYLNLFRVPIVAVGNNIGGVPYVGVNDRAAMQDMTERVLGEGYQNIIYFSPALRYPNAHSQRARYEGFLRTVGEKNHTVLTDIGDIQQAYDRSTAIICSTDYYALQVYFKAKGVRITGFDNLDIMEKYGIEIDSVGYSAAEVAKTAVDIILGSCEAKTRIVGHVIAEHRHNASKEN